VLATAEAAEARKTAKYSAMAHSRGAKFFPMVMELTGGMGKGCAELIKKLQSVAGHQRAWAPIELVRGLKMELSVLVQTWNAKIVLAGLSKSRRLAGV
jgi:hypothetical protein